MQELGVSNKGLAHRMREASQRDGGKPIATSHTTIARYRAGENEPRPRALELMLSVLSRKAGRRIAAEQIGYVDPEQPSQRPNV
ncbi:hypothetical protein ACIRRA_25050 [Nocardia sp. NPDC101769]|uniref:hypothetical protein n=1 Tax=Nocardia sp. NPDC101769 TaxID=3364333 RepID=UPI00382377AD